MNGGAWWANVHGNMTEHTGRHHALERALSSFLNPYSCLTISWSLFMILSTLSKWSSRNWIWLWHAFPQIRTTLHDKEASLVTQMVKNPPAMQKTQVRSLGWEDPLAKGMATHSSILAWRIPWTEELEIYSLPESNMTELLTLHNKFFNVTPETIPELPTICPSLSQHSLTHILSSRIIEVISVSPSCWILCHMITPTFWDSSWTSFPGSFYGLIQVAYNFILLYSQLGLPWWLRW